MVVESDKDKLTQDEKKLIELYRKLDRNGKKDLFIWANVCYEAMIKEDITKGFRVISFEGDNEG